MIIEDENINYDPGPYKLTVTCFCILNPLGEKSNVNLTFRVDSITKLRPHCVGRAEIFFVVFENAYGNEIYKTMVLVQDTNKLVDKLKYWPEHIVQRIESKLKQYVTEENTAMFANEFMELRTSAKELILNEKIVV